MGIQQSDMKRTFGDLAKRIGKGMWLIDSRCGEFVIIVQFVDGVAHSQVIVKDTSRPAWVEVGSTDDIAVAL